MKMFLFSQKLFLAMMMTIISFQVISCAKLQTVGIVSIPKFLDEKDQQKYESVAINPTYVKWLEASGAETVVIHPWYTPEQIDVILNKVNGIVLQGSLYNYDFSKGNPYIDTVLYILLSVATKDEGNKVPLIGIDDGFHLLHQILSEGADFSKIFKNYNSSAKLEFDLDRIKTTKMFSFFNEKDLNNLRESEVTYNLYKKGISPSAYQEHKAFREFFRITSVARDADGKPFIATVEAYENPIYGIQFRPDAISYLRKSHLSVPNSNEAIRAAREFGNFFVQNCKESNKNTFEVADYEKYSFIDPYSHSPVFDISVDNFVYTFQKPKDV